MEVWKAIEGYEVSDMGRVRNARGKIMKTFINNSGYECIKLNGKAWTVHRLVAQAFCEGFAPWLEINHIDADRLNNSAINLEWTTRRANVRDTIKRGTHDVKTAQAVAQVKNRRAVEMIDTETGDVVAVFPSMKEAEAVTGTSRHKISLVCSGKRKTSGGYKWRKVQ